MPEFSKDYGVSAATSALSLSLTTGVLAFAMLFAGGVSDAVGRKSVMTASLLSSAVLVLLTALVPDWNMLLVLRALLGLTLSGLPAVAMTYLSEEMHPESIGLGMGLYISGNAIGGMGGRLVAGVLADFVGWRWGVATVGLIGLVSGLIFWRSLPPSRHHLRHPLQLQTLMGRFALAFRDAGLPWLFAEGFLLLGAFVTLYNYIGYRLLAPPYGLGQAVVGAIFSVYLIGTFSSACREAGAPQGAMDGIRADAAWRGADRTAALAADRAGHRGGDVRLLRRPFHRKQLGGPSRRRRQGAGFVDVPVRVLHGLQPRRRGRRLVLRVARMEWRGLVRGGSRARRPAGRLAPVLPAAAAGAAVAGDGATDPAVTGHAAHMRARPLCATAASWRCRFAGLSRTVCAPTKGRDRTVHP
jgi:MFS family permease